MLGRIINHVYEWLQMWVGLVIWFIYRLQPVTTVTNAIANSRTLNVTTARTYLWISSFFINPLVTITNVRRSDDPLPLDSTDPVPQPQHFSYGSLTKTCFRLKLCTPLKKAVSSWNWILCIFEVISRQTVSRQIYPGIRPPYGKEDNFFLFIRNYLYTLTN
jgi:hypothetical protein